LFLQILYCEMSWGDWNGSNPEYEKGSPLGLNGRCAEAIKPALIFWAGSVDSLPRTCIESPPQKNLYFFNKGLHGGRQTESYPSCCR
jgi:hypothetical protein